MVVDNYRLKEKYDLTWFEVVLARYVFFWSFFSTKDYKFPNFNAFNTLSNVRCSFVAC
jgi:hypothetical protein